MKYHLAVTHLRAGEVSKAQSFLEQALTLDPGFSDAVLLRSELNLRSGNPATAIPPLVELLKNQPEHARAALLLATAYQAQGRSADALRVYRELCVRFPKNPEPWTLAGGVLRKQGNLPEARANFEKSAQLAPAYIPAVERLVELDVLATNYSAALARCAKVAAIVTNSAAPLILEAKIHGARGDLKAAEAALLRGAERDPNSLSVYGLLAGLYVDAKDYDKALTRLDGMIARDRKATAAWMQKGVIYESRNQTAQAKEAYRGAIKANPAFAPALNNLAFLVAEDPRQLEEAFAMASKARQVAPLDPSIADTLGWIQFKRRNFLAARRLIAESAEKLNQAEVHYHLAMAEYALGDERAARGAFDRALKGGLRSPLREDAEMRVTALNVDVVSAKQPQIDLLESLVKSNSTDYFAQLRLGTIYQAQGAFEKAKQALEAASRANPQAALPLLGLARLYSVRDSARAFQFAKDARKLDPNNRSVALTLGSLALRSGDYPLALTALQEGVRAEESTDGARYELALAQYAMGHVAQARATLEAVARQSASGSARVANESLLLIDDSARNSAARASAAEARIKANPSDFLALVALAEIREKQNLVPDAVKLYEKALKLSPDFWPAHQRLALLYAEHLKDDKAAHTHALAARNATPNDALLTEILGKIALRKGDFANAIRSFEEAARIEPASGEPYYLIGLANYHWKRTNDCRVALAKAVGLPLKPESAAEARRMLTELK